MTTLVFTDINSSINVSFRTNLINSTDDNFTVVGVDGLSDAEVHFGFNFRQLPTTLAAFKEFARVNFLKLTAYVSGIDAVTSPIVIVDWTSYYAGSLGSDNI